MKSANVAQGLRELGAIKMRLLTFSAILITSSSMLFFPNDAHSCELTMVYKDGGKEPLITKKPNNEGVYFDLFSEAAKRIDCKLNVRRLPKKRLHMELEKGQLDFYPGASFSKKRAKYLYYIPNGLQTGEYGVTNLAVPELNSYDDLLKHNATWLMENGSSKADKAKALGVRTHERTHQDLDIVSKFIQRKPDNNYFYVADKELVDFFPKKYGKKNLAEAGLKVHKNCCGSDQPMYMGFSRFSKNFQESENASYNSGEETSPDNFPTTVNSDSVAGRLGSALAAMKNEGVTDEIYNRWFGQ